MKFATDFCKIEGFGLMQRRLSSQLFQFVCLLCCLALFAHEAESQPPVDNLLGGAVDPGDPKYQEVAKAVSLFQQGNGREALKLLQNAKAEHPELPPGEVIFAHLCFSGRNAQAGREALQYAAVHHKDDPEVWNMLADLQLRSEGFAEAEVLFKKSVELANAYEQNPVRKMRQLANAHAGAAAANEKRSLWKEAEPHLLAWQKITPDNIDISSRLATVYLNTQQFDKATATLHKLHELDPKQLPAEIVLATTYEKFGKTEEAKKSVQEAVTKYPEDFYTQVAAARWALGAGHIELARQYAEKANSLSDESQLPTLILGQTHYLNGKFQEAEALFLKVYESTPESFDAVNGLASSILSQDDASRYQQAREYAEVNVQQYQGLQTVRGRQAVIIMAWALHKNGETEEANRLMDRVLSSGAISSENAFIAAEIFSRQGRNELAQEILKKALASETQFPHRKQAEKLQKELTSASSAE